MKPLCVLALILLAGCEDPKATQRASSDAVRWERTRTARIIRAAANKRLQAGKPQEAGVLLGVLSQIEDVGK